jgi:hypothetical protein
LATAPFGLTDEVPICSTIASTPEAVPVDKSFDQMELMAVFMLPVSADSFHYDGQKMAGQMRDSDPGQYEKSLSLPVEVVQCQSLQSSQASR